MLCTLFLHYLHVPLCEWHSVLVMLFIFLSLMECCHCDVLLQSIWIYTQIYLSLWVICLSQFVSYFQEHKFHITYHSSLMRNYILLLRLFYHIVIGKGTPKEVALRIHRFANILLDNIHTKLQNHSTYQKGRKWLLRWVSFHQVMHAPAVCALYGDGTGAWRSIGRPALIRYHKSARQRAIDLSAVRIRLRTRELETATHWTGLGGYLLACCKNSSGKRIKKSIPG